MRDDIKSNQAASFKNGPEIITTKMLYSHSFCLSLNAVCTTIKCTHTYLFLRSYLELAIIADGASITRDGNEEREYRLKLSS